MIGFLKRLMGGGGGDGAPPSGEAKKKGGQGFDAPLEIDMPTYAIGDMHGRADLLERLLGRINQDAKDRGYEAWRLVTMGDYVDRGEQSAQVLARLRGIVTRGGWANGPAEVVALRGNHEEMMVAFVDAPAEAGARWLRNGGLQTLASYEIGGVAPTTEGEALVEVAARFAEAAAEDLAMVRELPAWARFGKVLFAHAGADPEAPPELQSDRTMTWGVSRFFSIPRKDGLWVVYGHYVVDEAGHAGGRIAVDTGAYYSGVLSAVRLETGVEPAFLTS
ncbi:metallophosphoesterase [Albimonas sp. CAU 1670]|uniref:metallophosphoesterase n=1 Tax=Albimonas sp. CAU 1670 TaxID=3032599 RepID=UPI0023DA8586|nr:metallophosphoesterase [Albimonas sp. CAU 1670]MDF2231447.1 metallophosphoesterase [Albimonas sp. CAU 1670]